MLESRSLFTPEKVGHFEGKVAPGNDDTFPIADVLLSIEILTEARPPTVNT